MANSKYLEDCSKYLENLRIREKLMRTLQYGLLVVTPFIKAQISRKRGRALENISGQIGISRILLRCFDDLSMLHYTVGYGWGKHESNFVLRVLNLIENGSGLLFYPVEHFAFVQDMDLIKGESSRAWNIGLTLWAISLASSIARCLIRLYKMQFRSVRAKDPKVRAALMRRKLMQEFINIVMFSSDLLNALNWLSYRPCGAEPFPSWMVGALGLASSLAGLYNLVKSEQSCF